jgi:hypothetical protein
VLVGELHERAHMRDVVAGRQPPEQGVGVAVDAVIPQSDHRDAAVGEVPL